MRILQVTHGLPPEALGGVEMHVDTLSRELVRAGHEVHVLVRSSDRSLAQGRTATRPGRPTITRAAYRWEGLRAFEDIMRCPPMADTVASFLAERDAAGERFDVAHIHHLTGMSTDTLEVLHRHGMPTVFTLHDYWLFCPRGQMYHPDRFVCETVEPVRCGACLARTWPGLLGDGQVGAEAALATHDRARGFFAMLDRLCVPSPRALPPVRALGVERPAEIVEYGIDTERLRAIPAARPNAERPLRVGFFGTLIPSKGVEVLVEAALRLPPATVELRLYGNTVNYHGDASYLTRTFEKLRPGTSVSYFGPYAPDQMAALLTEVDVVTAPALWAETYGIAVREGMAAGRPALVSRIGGLQDAVEDGVDGFVLEPGDVAAWSAALATLARDRERVVTMGEAARARGRDHAAVASQLLGIYRDCATSR